MNHHFIADSTRMSKFATQMLPVLGAFLAILQIFTIAAGQDVDVRIRITADSPHNAEITYRSKRQLSRRYGRNLSFLNEYAGIRDLGNRFSHVDAFAPDARPVNLKQLNRAEYVSDAEFSLLHYNADLTPASDPVAAAHLSWSRGDTVLIILDDLLPQPTDHIAANVTFDLPAGWNVFGPTATSTANQFYLPIAEKAVFLIGPGMRQKQGSAAGAHFRITTTGDWRFTDEDTADMAAEIFSTYAKAFGSAPVKEFQIAIVKFPVPVPIANWEADTRGNSITIASSDMPFRSQSLQRLHEQLRHEIFHLWIPEGVNLSGHYDWFYEGFAIYQSLKLGVETNRIGFNDFLNTLSQAYNLDNSVSRHASLIDASHSRWTGSGSEVYARGMLVAFLSDLALLQASKGKTSSADLVREVYHKYHLAVERQDGNADVLAIIRSHAELRDIATHYISGGMAIDWRNDLAAAGIEAISDNGRTTLKVVSKPNGRQKDLLNKLGYNNWRKLSH
jgi:hypothetical protein